MKIVSYIIPICLVFWMFGCREAPARGTFRKEYRESKNRKDYKREKKDAISGTITNITYSGDSTKLTINITDELVINARVIDENKYHDGDLVFIDFDEDFVVPLRS